MKHKNLYYTLKQINNDYFLNDLKIDYKTANKITAPKYKQISYTCYFNKNQDFVREWTMRETNWKLEHKQ